MVHNVTMPSSPYGDDRERSGTCAGIVPEQRMFHILAGFLVPISFRLDVEADSFEQACAKAVDLIAKGRIDGKRCWDAKSPTYVWDLWETFMDHDPVRAIVPKRFRDPRIAD